MVVKSSKLCLVAAVAALAMGGSAQANLVTNGNFAGNLNGWNNSDASIVYDTTFRRAGEVGDADFTGSGTLSQGITTTSGTTYTLSFWVASQSGFTGDSFNVDFGGVMLHITGDKAANVYVSETLVLPGTSSMTGTTTLSFTGANTGVGDWNLADVVVTADIPEPGSAALFAGFAMLAFGTAARRRSH